MYLLVPQPGLERYSLPRLVEGGYANGALVGGPGHVRVTVSRESALVELVQARLAGIEEGNGRVTYSFRVAARRMEERP